MRLRVGDWIEVRSKEEILTTLDKNGRMEGLPFMPQMFQYCGRRFRVFKRAHKTCDTVNGTGGRRLPGGVHLETRCDGDAFGGCQAGCLIFWQEAWLKKITDPTIESDNSSGRDAAISEQATSVDCCTEAAVWRNTRADDPRCAGEARYRCQATELPNFTIPLPWWDVKQYIEDYTSGNVTLRQLLSGFIYAGYSSLLNAGIGVGPLMRMIYDVFQTLRGGFPYPRRKGTIPAGQPTPTSTLNLQPGEYVRVKSYKQILATVDRESRNKGLSFDAEHVPYCGGIYSVKTRITKFLDEKTGKLITPKNVSIILEGVCCQARYSYCRMFCPRSIYPWWREIWLDKISDPRSP